MKKNELTLQEGDKFVVTGVCAYSSKRFKPIHTSNYRQAMSYNIWRGHVWLLRDNKRTCIKSVWN